MKKLSVFIFAAAAVFGAIAGPGGHGGPRPGGHCPGPAPRIHHAPPPSHHHNHYSEGTFWRTAGAVALGTVVGNVISTPVVTTPVVSGPVATSSVVAAPVVTTTYVPDTRVAVWIPGQYVDQVRADGVIVRIWHAGHYEYR